MGCDKKGSAGNCLNNVSINAVQPNTNPAGYEVLIKAPGFTNAAKVFFGSVQATSRAGGESDDIIAKVPAGLSGNVEISVEEGDCIARSGGFIVSGSLPSGVQPSLPQIIIPVPATSISADIGNVYKNAAGTGFGQSIQIVKGDTNGDVITIDPSSVEFINSVTNPVSGFVNINTNVVQLVIDRTANGGSIEHFDGQFIALPNPAVPGATAAILLVSRETGRQLLIFKS